MNRYANSNDGSREEREIVVLGFGSEGIQAFEFLEGKDITFDRLLLDDSNVSLSAAGEKPTYDLVVLLGGFTSEIFAQDVLKVVRGYMSPSTQGSLAVIPVPFSHLGEAARQHTFSQLTVLAGSGFGTVGVLGDFALRQLSSDATLQEAESMQAKLMADAVLTMFGAMTALGDANVSTSDALRILRSGDVGFFAVGHGANARAAAFSVADLAADAGVPVSSASGCVMTISGGADLSIENVTIAAAYIQERTGDEAEIVFGVLRESATGAEIKVSSIWSGFRLVPELLAGLPITSAPALSLSGGE